MTDRELLEDAAKAAGMETRYDRVTGQTRARVPHSGDAFPVWNPLVDDGAAFRLAVKLDLRVFVGYASGVGVGGFGEGGLLTKADPCAATRRAIVRAAAAMVSK